MKILNSFVALLFYVLVLINTSEQSTNSSTATCNFTTPNFQGISCSSNPDCQCFSLALSPSTGICGSKLFYCASVVRCNMDNVTCLVESTICVTNTNCGQPICYPLPLANKLVCPVFIPTTTGRITTSTTKRTSTTSKTTTTTKKTTIASTKSTTTIKKTTTTSIKPTTITTEKTTTTSTEPTTITTEKTTTTSTKSTTTTTADLISTIPQYCQWSSWVNWPCSVSCGTGTFMRQRPCLDQFANKCNNCTPGNVNNGTRPCYYPSCPSN